MYTTFHFQSAKEINEDILDAIKSAFKNKPIVLTVEEYEEDFELTTEMKTVLDERLQEDEKTYLSGEDSIKQLNKKYGL